MVINGSYVKTGFDLFQKTVSMGNNISVDVFVSVITNE